LTAEEAANLATLWQAVDLSQARILAARWTYDPACAECHGGGIAAEYDWITGRGWRCACAKEAPHE
jgi:hypothetical protein